MLTWVWLTDAQCELAKPKSTFHPQNFLLGLHAIIICKKFGGCKFLLEFG